MTSSVGRKYMCPCDIRELIYKRNKEKGITIFN